MRKSFYTNFSSNYEDISISYAELIERISNVKVPKNYLNSKFSDIVKHIQPETALRKPEAKSLTIKTRDFAVSQDSYENYLDRNRSGTYEAFKYKGKHIGIMGFNYTNVKLADIWKTLLLSKADVILLAVRPDLFLRDFRLNLRNPKTENFSNRLYYAQLELDPMAVVCNQELEHKVAQHIDSVFMSKTAARMQQ